MIILKFFVSNPLYFFDAIISSQLHSSVPLDSQDKFSLKILMLKFYSVYLLQFLIDFIKLIYYTVLTYQIYQANLTNHESQINKREYDEAKEDKQSEMKDINSKNRQRLMNLSILMIIFEISIFDTIFQIQSQKFIFEIINNINKSDTVLNLFLFSIYIQFYNCSDFIKIYQLNFLQKLLRVVGIKYNKNVTFGYPLWDCDEDHLYIQIIFFYQILLTAYKSWVILNSNEVVSQSEKQISFFQKLNEFNYNSNASKDQMYLGSYVQILKNEQNLNKIPIKKKRFLHQICDAILRSSYFNVQIFIEQFNNQNILQIDDNIQNQFSYLLKDFKIYLKNIQKIYQKQDLHADSQDIELENFIIEEENELKINLKLFIENIQSEKLGKDQRLFTFSNRQIFLKLQIFQTSSHEKLLCCQAFSKQVKEVQDDTFNQKKTFSEEEEKQILNKNLVETFKHEDQVSLSTKALFENYQQTFEKSKMDEETAIYHIKEQEKNARNEYSDSIIKKSKLISTVLESEPQISNKQQKKALLSFGSQNINKRSGSNESNQEKYKSDAGSVSIETDLNTIMLQKITQIGADKNDSSSSSSYTVQANEQILQQQSLDVQNVNIIKKDSNNSIKSNNKQIKKRNPKVLKKTQTSNVSYIRRRSVLASGIKPFKKQSSKNLELLFDQSSNKDDEIQILQQLGEQIQQIIQSQSQDSPENIKHIQLINCSNELSIEEKSSNNHSINQSYKNLKDQLHLIQQIICQKNFLSQYNNKLMNQEQKNVKSFKGSLNRSGMRAVLFQNPLSVNEIKPSAIKNSLNIQRNRSASISDVRARKFGLQSQESNPQNHSQISQELQKLIQFYEGKIEQKQTALDFYKKKTKEIQYSLDSNKIFLNMVVHDMRNPSNQLEFLVKQTLILLKESKKMLLQIKSCAVPQNRQIVQEEEKVADGSQIVQIKNNRGSRKNRNNNQKINNQIILNNIQEIEQNKNEISKKILIIKNSKQKLIEAKNEEQKEDIQQNEIQLQILPKFQNQLQIKKSVDENKNQIQIKKENEQDLNHHNIEKFVEGKIEDIQKQKQQFLEKLQQLDRNFYNDHQNVDKPLNEFEVIETDDIILQIQDQEPRITRELARKLHLSFNPGLIFLNTLKNQILQQVQKEEVKSRQIPKLQLIKQNNIFEFEIVRQESDQIVENQIANKDQIEMQRVPWTEMQSMIDKLDQAISQLENCKYCSVMLLNLINDMMDLAKTEQMQFELNNEFFDVTKTVERAFDTLSYFGEQKNIKPKMVIDKQIEIFFKNIKGDENRFTQIFLNFLSNAFKFTPQNGSITLEICQANDENCLQKIIPQQQQVIAQRKFMSQMKSPSSGLLNHQLNSQGIGRMINQQEENGQRADDLQEGEIIQISDIREAAFDEYYISFQIRIKDSGMGISQENIGKLFLNFGKLADTQGVNKQGTGLGLSICKTLIEKMGGKVHVESEGQGKGTTFVITMQSISKILKQKEILEMEQNNNASIPDRSISQELTFKQNDVVFHQQKKALEKGIMESHNIDLSYQEHSAQRLLPKINQNSSERKGPSKNSFQIKKSIKNNKSPSKVFKDKLHDSFDSSSGNQHINNEQSQMMDNGINHLRVLIINDEFFILQMLVMMVKSIEIYNIDTAPNGFDGFNLVKINQYDFVICDLNMPVMNGFECCQKIKAFYDNYNQQFFQVKVNLEKECLRPYMVACSALINHQIEQKAIRSGFDLVVESPLTVEILRQIISKCSQHKQKEQLIFKQNKMMRQEINLEEEEKQEQQQSNGRVFHQDLQVQDLINNLDKSIRNSHENKFNKSGLNAQSISISDLDSDMSASLESSFYQDQVQNIFKRGKSKQSQKEGRDVLNSKLSSSIQDKIEEEDDEVSYSDDSQSRNNIVMSNEFINELKISNDNHELQEEKKQDILQNNISSEQKKESKESLVRKIKKIQKQNFIKSSFSMASQSLSSDQSSNND